MKQVSIREARHHLARVLAFVQDGEEIEITRRDVVVARIVPAAGRRGVSQTVARPDYRARLGAIYGSIALSGTSAADEIVRGRSRDA